MPRQQAVNTEALVTQLDPRSPVAEAYRQLRTNIQFSSLERPLRTLLVTSAGPAEGKSTTLANLAITFAQAGHRVVLVDADLRRPSLHRTFGLPNEAGLTSAVLAGDNVPPALLSTGVENLRLLPSGPLPPNPSELLGSRRVGDLLKQLRADADYLLLDSPPIVAVTDAAVLATRVDGVLLVLEAGKTRRELGQRAKALLDKVNAHLVGVVLNNVGYDTGLGSYYGEGRA